MREFKVVLRDGHYLEVFVHDSQESMHAAVWWQEKKNFYAIVCGMERLIGGQPDKLYLGQMHFYEGQIGAGVVSHETVHAAARWFNRQGYQSVPLQGDEALVGMHEEVFARIVGDFNNRLIRLFHHDETEEAVNVVESWDFYVKDLPLKIYAD